MAKLLESKFTAWTAMVLTLALIVLSFCLHTPWWGFIALFFLFIAVFMHIMSLYLRKISAAIGKKMDNCSFVCLILSLLAFITEYILYNVYF